MVLVSDYADFSMEVGCLPEVCGRSKNRRLVGFAYGGSLPLGVAGYSVTSDSNTFRGCFRQAKTALRALLSANRVFSFVFSLRLAVCIFFY